MPPEDKDAALFPRRIGGRWAMIHRPSPIGGFAHMWISYSPDLRHWGDHELLLEARDGAWWDAGKIGLGPPPLETATAGWSATTAFKGRRRGRSIGWAWPCWTSTTRAPSCVGRTSGSSRPTAPYERSGDVNKVVFPTGWVLDPTTQVLSIYYGAGDSVIALVTAKLDDILALLRTAPAD